MTKLDEKKLEIDFLQKQFFVSLAVMFALLSWMATHYMNANLLILSLAFVAFFFFCRIRSCCSQENKIVNS